MSIGRIACCALVLSVALIQRARAQDSTVSFAEQAPLTVSGFAVGDAGYDQNMKQGTAVASKIALSLFRAWSDNLYLFGQLTTHVSQHDTSGVHTHIEIDNLIINWTPPKLSALSLGFGRFDAPIGFERDDERGPRPWGLR